MHAVGIVADDLTGGLDTAQGFAARGYGTTVVADPAADSAAVGDDAAVLGSSPNRSRRNSRSART